MLRVMLTASVTTTAGVSPVFLTGAMAVQIGRSLPLSGDRLGVAVAAFFATSAVCAAMSGRVADRVGARAVMRAGLVPTVLALGALAALVRTWPELVVAMAVAGTGNGAIQPAANGYVASAVGDGRRGLAFGVKQAAIPAATLLSGLAVPVIALSVGWRWAFVAAAVLAAGLVVTVGHGTGDTSPGAPLSGASPDGSAAGRRTVAAIAPLERRGLLVLAAGCALGSAASNALGAFVVVNAVHTGISASDAGLVAAVGGATSLVMRLAIGHRADRHDGGHFRVVAVLMVVGTAGFVALATGDVWLLVPAVIVGYGAGWAWAGLLTFAVADTHRDAAARATGMTQTGASVGACVGPLGFGILVASLGWGGAWDIAAGVLGLAALLIVAGTRVLGHRGSPAQPLASGDQTEARVEHESDPVAGVGAVACWSDPDLAH